MKTILKSIVGSKAHGLDTPKSDIDLRGVFLVPTSELLSLGYKEKAVAWVEGQGEDATAYEISHFLELACRSNPSILEVLVSPIKETTEEGTELRNLFPYIWNSIGVFNAFKGYSNNQRKKFIEDKDDRPWKYAVAQIRTLLLGIELLKLGTMTVNVEEQQNNYGDFSWDADKGESIKEILMGMKEGYFRDKGFVIDWAISLEKQLTEAYSENPNKQTDHEKVNNFLLNVRKNNW